MKNPYDTEFAATLEAVHQERPGITPATVIYPTFFLSADTEHPGNRLHILSGMPPCLAKAHPNMSLTLVLVMRPNGDWLRLCSFIAN